MAAVFREASSSQILCRLSSVVCPNRETPKPRNSETRNFETPKPETRNSETRNQKSHAVFLPPPAGISLTPFKASRLCLV